MVGAIELSAAVIAPRSLVSCPLTELQRRRWAICKINGAIPGLSAQGKIENVVVKLIREQLYAFCQLIVWSILCGRL